MAGNLYRQNMVQWGAEQSDKAPGGMASTLETAAADDLEATLMAVIAQTLEHHYPAPKGLALWWGVEVAGSITMIYNLILSGQYGYVLHTKNITTEKVVRAGGEILERFRIPRHRTRQLAAQAVMAQYDALDTYQRLTFDA